MLTTPIRLQSSFHFYGQKVLRKVIIFAEGGFFVDLTTFLLAETRCKKARKREKLDVVDFKRLAQCFA